MRVSCIVICLSTVMCVCASGSAHSRSPPRLHANPSTVRAHRICTTVPADYARLHRSGNSQGVHLHSLVQRFHATSTTATAGWPFSGDCFLQYCHIVFFTFDLCSGPLAHTQRCGSNKTDGASDLAELPPHIPIFFQYLRDFLTVRIDPAKYKFLCMPESYSDLSICTQEPAAHLKIHRASHLRCAPGYRHNDITVLIIGKPNICIFRVIFIA